MYKLRIHLIPQSAYGKNMRSVMTNSEWNTLSKYVRDVEVCAGCLKAKSMKKLEAHEIWKFKDGKMKLKHIYPLCKKCHRSVHIGRAIHCNKGEKAAKRIMRYGKIPKDNFKQYYQNQWDKWRIRSTEKWTLKTTKEQAWEIAEADKNKLLTYIDNHTN